jgi:hypothetical protein
MISTLTTALANSPPTDLQQRLQMGSLIIGRIIAGKLVCTSVDQVQSAFNTIFWIFSYNSQRVIRLQELAEVYHLVSELTVVCCNGLKHTARRTKHKQTRCAGISVQHKSINSTNATAGVLWLFFSRRIFNPYWYSSN